MSEYTSSFLGRLVGRVVGTGPGVWERALWRAWLCFAVVIYERLFLRAFRMFSRGRPVASKKARQAGRQLSRARSG